MMKGRAAGLLFTLVATVSAHADEWRDCAQAGDSVLAIQGCSRIIAGGQQTDANLAIAYIDRGGAYFSQDHYDRAIADYGKAIQLKPDYAESYAGRGNAYYRDGNYERAIADYGKAIKLKPGFENYTGRGLAYFARGDYDQAVADLQAAASVISAGDPKHKEAIQRLALVKRRLQEERSVAKRPSHSGSSGTGDATSGKVNFSADAETLGGLREGFAE